jgi:hypothetical protein
MSAARKMHNALEASRRDMLAQCQSGDEFACRYLIDHDAAEHIQPEPDPFTMRQFPELVVGAFVVWLLVMALLGVGL